MNTISGAIAGYRDVNNFYTYDSLRVDTLERVPYNNRTGTDTEDISTDDIAAYASISPEAIALYQSEQGSNSESNQKSNTGSGNDELTQQEQREVSELKMTDSQVKAHEHAHKAAAAGLSTSGPNYEYETGPDGKKYAVAGDVNVSYKHSDDPEVNLRNAQQLRASALAPADPSSQDRKVAMQAEREIAQARQEIMEEQRQTEEQTNSSDSTTSNVSTENNASAFIQNQPEL